MDSDSDLITTKEAARIIKHDYRTLENWRCENKNGKKHPDLKPIKIGKKIFYLKQVCIEFRNRNIIP